MPRIADSFGTPSTVDSDDNNMLGTPVTPKHGDEISPDIIYGSIDAESNSSHTPPSSEGAQITRLTIQTPPTPDDNVAVETPPSSSSELIDMRSPPSAERVECTNAVDSVIHSQSYANRTPVSNGQDDTKFETPCTDEGDAKCTATSNKATQYTNSNTRSLRDQSSQKKQQKKAKTQMYIDLGQKSFASHRICHICSSLIVHGTHEDQQNHINICKSYKEGVTYLGFKKERCLTRFGEERIIEVREGDTAGRKKVEEVKRIVDGELGFATSTKHTEHKDSLQGITSYLYVVKKRIVGLLLCKRINKAYELLYQQNGDKTTSISRGTTPYPAIMGIHQIWVHRLHRHQGIATKLLECARDNFTFGMVIPIEKIAFSSPTENGVGLAKRFVGDDEKVLVYDIS